MLASLLTLTLLACAKPTAAPVSAQAAGPPPGVSVRDDGVVRIEAAPVPDPALTERLSQYLQVRYASAQGLGPGAERMAVLTRFGETSQVHIVDHPLGARTQVTFRDEPIGGAIWTPDGDLLFSADTGGDEQYQLLRFDLETGRTDMITDGQSRNGDGLFSHAGDRLAFSSTARNGKDRDIWLSDARDPGTAELLVEATGSWSPTAWSPDDERLVLTDYVSSTEARLLLVHVASGQLDVLTEGVEAFHGNSTFGPDGDTLYVVSDRDGAYRRLWQVDLAAGTWRSLTDDVDWNVEGLALAPSGGALLFTINQEGWSTLHRLDLDTGTHSPIEGIPAGIIRGLDFARDADVASFTLSRPTAPSDAWSLELATGELTQWTQSEVGGLDTERFIEPELVRYQSFDGRQIPAFYYRPPGDGPFPVLIRIHGGPEAQARPRLSSTTQYLATEAGVAVLVPNVRGSNGYGTEYLLLDNGPLREDSVRDIGSLLDWVDSRPELDAGRVGVSGGSYGGYMVLASLVHYSDRLVAGADAVGIANFVTFLENTKAYRRDLRRAEYGDERDPQMRALLEQISPVNRADEIDAPLFVSHGANDPRVPIGEAEQIVAAVREGGHEAWLMVARNEGHGFHKKANRDLYTALWITFFERHLFPDSP